LTSTSYCLPFTVKEIIASSSQRPKFIADAPYCQRISKIQPHAQRDDSRIRTGIGNTAEIRRVNVRIWIVECLVVQHIDRVTSDNQLLAFANLNSLNQIDMEPEIAGTLQITR